MGEETFSRSRTTLVLDLPRGNTLRVQNQRKEVFVRALLEGFPALGLSSRKGFDGVAAQDEHRTPSLQEFGQLLLNDSLRAADASVAGNLNLPCSALQNF